MKTSKQPKIFHLEEEPYTEADVSGENPNFPDQGIEVIPKVINPKTGEAIADQLILGRKDDGTPRVKKMLGPRVSDRQEIPEEAILHDSFTVEDFDHFPELQWLVDDLFHKGSTVMLWGPSGVGKTALLIDLVASIATGSRWFDRTVHPCKVLYCAMEGAAGFRQRIMAVADHRAIELGDRMRFIFDPFDLSDERHINGLALTAVQHQIGLIVIDTLAAALAGKLDENSNQAMAEVIDHIRTLSNMTGATVIFTHHAGHNQRHARGATALLGGVDTSICIQRTKEKTTYWKIEKQRDGIGGSGANFSLVDSKPLHGKTMSSVLVEYGKKITNQSASANKSASIDSTQKQTARTPGPQQAKIFNLIEELWNEKIKLSTKEQKSQISIDEIREACKKSKYKIQNQNSIGRDIDRTIVFYQEIGRIQRINDNHITLI